MTASSARSVMLTVPASWRTVNKECWVARKPVGRNTSSYTWVTARVALRKLKHTQFRGSSNCPRTGALLGLVMIGVYTRSFAAVKSGGVATAFAIGGAQQSA